MRRHHPVPQRRDASEHVNLMKKWLAILGEATAPELAVIIERTMNTASILLREACERGELKRRSETVRGVYYRYLYSLPKEKS